MPYPKIPKLKSSQREWGTDSVTSSTPSTMPAPSLTVGKPATVGKNLPEALAKQHSARSELENWSASQKTRQVHNFVDGQLWH